MHEIRPGFQATSSLSPWKLSGFSGLRRSRHSTPSHLQVSAGDRHDPSICGALRSIAEPGLSAARPRLDVWFLRARRRRCLDARHREASETFRRSALHKATYMQEDKFSNLVGKRLETVITRGLRINKRFMRLDHQSTSAISDTIVSPRQVAVQASRSSLQIKCASASHMSE